VDVRGRVALVTGGGSGIGRATAVAIARCGAEAVVVADLDEAGGTDTVDLIEAAGARGKFIRVDLTVPTQLAQLFADVEHRFGPPSVVHNNAGIVSAEPGWPNVSLARIERVIATNVTAVVMGTRLAVEHLRGRGGCIVNTASIVGLRPFEEDPVYAATKAAVVNFTRSAAPKLAEMGIRINAVAPGAVNTPILAKTGDGTSPAPWLAERLAGRALLRPAHIADAVLALIENEDANGEVVVVTEPPADADPA
jgi:NAD(P)-dependent dehydrogenase (short-subunit alcohol dehydrogenase family)